jgi:hypothetical protein
MVPSVRPIAARFDDPAVRAMVLAFLVLDAHMAVFKEG